MFSTTIRSFSFVPSFGSLFVSLMMSINNKKNDVMKKACVIISSMIGGAVVGSVIALLSAPKSGRELREDLHDAVMGKLNLLQDQVKEYGCNCNYGDSYDDVRDHEKGE